MADSSMAHAVGGVHQTTKHLKPITGWASGGSTFGDEHEKSVVIGPDATASGLLSWGIGQIQQLTILLDVIGCSSGSEGIEPSELCGAIRHHLQQAAGALDGAAELLAKQRKADGAK